MIIKITRGNNEKRNIYIFFFSFHFYFSGRGIFQSGERMEKRREEQFLIKSRWQRRKVSRFKPVPGFTTTLSQGNKQKRTSALLNTSRQIGIEEHSEASAKRATVNKRVNCSRLRGESSSNLNSKRDTVGFYLIQEKGTILLRLVISIISCFN